MKYHQYLDNIDADTLYEGLLGYGMFENKLPPAFTSIQFCQYCKVTTFTNDTNGKRYIDYVTNKNTEGIRRIGIPHPIAYQQLCRCLADNWTNLCTYFRSKTEKQNYKVSRLHLRRQKGDHALFSMNYKDTYTDGYPEVDMRIGKRFMVKADITNCFPSIYTHTIAWALVGKTKAKAEKSNSGLWYNCIDKHTQRIQHGETYGILVGPHTSNLISEIILCDIDEKLYKKWRYIRKIDDYECYVDMVCPQSLYQPVS